MSAEKLGSNARRWLAQAHDDLEATQALLDAGRFAQSCFWAQQSAEKALKAVWIILDLDPWGHSVGRLINEMPDDERRYFEDLVEQALHLDKLYIPTRYPDAIAELTPGEAYTRREAESALVNARELVKRARERLRAV